MKRRPFVLINMAMTADGKIATSNRKVSSFGSQKDFEHLLKLRATADAVMTGAGTINAQTDITLGSGPIRFRQMRRKNGLADAPLRIVVSGRGQLDTRTKLFRTRGAPIIVLTTKNISKTRLTMLKKAADYAQQFGQKVVDFKLALDWLRFEWKVKRLLCEGGGRLNNSLLAAGLVDELHITVCPKIFGGHDAPTIADGPLADSLANAKQFTLKSMTQKGDEMFLVYRAKVVS